MSQKSSEKNKAKYWFKVGAWIFGLALFLFVGLFFFTEWLQGKMERVVKEQSNGVYQLDLYGLEVSPFLGNVSVDSLSLVPSYKRWHELRQQSKKAPRTLLDLQSGSLQVSGINVFGILFGSNTNLENLTLQHPNILITVMRQDTTEEHHPIYKTATGFLKNIQIGKINVDSARLKYRENHKPADYLFSIKQFNLTIDDFKLDSQSYHAQGKSYYSRQIKLAATKVNYLLPDGQYRAFADSLLVNTNKQQLFARQLQLIPLSSLSEMAKAKGKSVTFTEMKASSLVINGINYHANSLYNSFKARHAELKNPSLNAYKDKQNYQDRGSKPLPHELVQNIKPPFLLDTLQITNGYVKYEELAPKAQQRGYITFNNLNVTATNLTNIPEQISKENPAVLQASTLVMGKAALDVKIKLPLLNENGYHTIEGSIGDANPEILNPILVPTSFVRVESGHISRGNFNAVLTKNKASGSMTVIYSNLELELLNKGSGGNQGLGMELVSEVADWVAIKDANPMYGGSPRVGDITVSRNPEKSVFNYWKNCLASGFLSSMGLQRLSNK